MNHPGRTMATAFTGVNLHAIHLPAGVTIGGAAVVILAFAALLVIGRMARTIGKVVHAAAVPVAAPAKSSGAGVKLLMLAVLAGGGAVAYARMKPALAGIAAKAGPAPSASPSPRPAVTQTVAPHIVPVHLHLPLTGGDIVAIFVIGAIVAIALGIQALRKSS